MRLSALRLLPFWPLLMSAAIPGWGAVEWENGSLKRVYQPPGKFYCYAPALVREGGADTILACHNSKAGVIRDDIFLLNPVERDVVSTRSVLTAGAPDAWDSFHMCDPSVVAGHFPFQGESYRWALFYLGNNADACINNQVGVAFAQELQGPWARMRDPVVAYPPCGRWGAGQPSAVWDGQSRLLLFYTKGIPGTAGYVREVRLEDSGRFALGDETKLTTRGLERLNGKPDYWNNFDVVYDPFRDWFWAIRECHPHPKEPPRQIPSTLEVLSIRAADLFNSAAAWRVEARLTPEVTGHARNHNACFERSPRGHLLHRDRLRVLFSTSCGDGGCAEAEDGNPLWTYGLWEITGRISAPVAGHSPGSAGVPPDGGILPPPRNFRELQR